MFGGIQAYYVGERKNSLKDELPDLTPYLNKKGGNSQGRGDENPAGKTDISSKLSALVKKPGSTGTHPSVQAALAAGANPEIRPEGAPTQSASPNSAVDDDQDGASSIGIVRRPAPPVADNDGDDDVLEYHSGSNGQNNFASSASPSAPAEASETPSRWGNLDAIGAQSWPSDTTQPDPSGSPSQSPAADNFSGSDFSNASQPAFASDSAFASNLAVASDPAIASRATSPPAVPTNFSAPAAFNGEESYPPSSSTSREMPKPGMSLDKLKGPQAKPMSTLSSSSAPPLLKTPLKQPGRPAQPYSYKPAIEPGRETMAPRGPSSSPVNKTPQPVAAPKPAMPQPPSNNNYSAPTAPTRPAQVQGQQIQPQATQSSSQQPVVQPQTYTPPAPQYQAPAPAVKPASSARVETDAEKLARAFREEAQALQAAPAEQSTPQGSYSGEDDLIPAEGGYADYRQELTAKNFHEEIRNFDSDALNVSSKNASQETSQEASQETFQETSQETSQDTYTDSQPAFSQSLYDQGTASYEDPAAYTESAPAYEESQPNYEEAAKASFEQFRAAANQNNPPAEESKLAATAPREAGPKASLSSLFDSGVLNSRSDEVSNKPIGFGNLLAGAASPHDEDKHSTIADLMVPTGEHDALFAPDRREPSESSAFDEIAAQVDADKQSVELSLSGEAPVEPPADSSSMRMADKSQAPAFSSLFSSEIVTSGSDFGNQGPGTSASSAEQVDSSSADDAKFLETASQAIDNAGFTESESKTPSPKSLAISKLIEAVNQEEAKDAASDFSSTTGDAGKGLFSSEIVGVSDDAPESASNPYGIEAPGEQHTPDLGALSPSALEALAAFVPKVGEEQHETKGLLAKLKAKDAAAKAALKNVGKNDSVAGKLASEIGSKVEAKGGTDFSARPDTVEALQNKPAEAPKSSLASLLGGSSEPEVAAGSVPVSFSGADAGAGSGANSAPVPVPDQAKVTPLPEPAPEEDEGSSLGDAISDALDKLLKDGEVPAGNETVETKPAPAVEMPAAAESFSPPSQPSSGLSKLLDDDPDRFDRPIGSNMKKAEEVLEAAITASAADPVAAVVQPPEAHPLTLTNSKVDALSRLLEVASKAPQKPPEEKPTAEPGNTLSDMINKSQAISRQQEGLESPDFNAQGNPQNPYTSPFGGGTSPFGASASQSQLPLSTTPGSPFGSAVNSNNNSGVSLTHTPAGAFSPTGQSAPSAADFGTGSMSDMPKASGIASDAISARIAALNRKLEEQGKSTGPSNTQSAMQPPSQSAAPSMSDLTPPPMPAAIVPTPDYSPNPIVDDSPQTRAELVNRILGSAKISQTALPDLPQRVMPEIPIDQQISQMHLPKGGGKAPPKLKARSRAGRPGINPLVVLLAIAVVVIAGLGGYVLLKDGHIKGLDLNTLSNKINKTIDTKPMTVDQCIKSGDTDKAIEMLEAKKETGKVSASEGEKLYGLYYQKAEKAYNNSEDPAEAIQTLEKIPKKTKKFKDAQKLLRKLKKKAEKN